MIGSNSFRRACSKFATGITIATVLAPDGTPHGLTVNSFTSVSMDPPLVLICIDRNANALPYFQAAQGFGISVLEESQQAQSNRFAARGEDRFQGVPWHGAESGVPLIDGALAHFDCALEQAIEAGDHTIFIGKVTGLYVQDGRPLLYFASAYQQLA